MDMPKTNRVLNQLLPVGILAHADILLPNEFQALHANFPPERPVPTLIARLFELPIQISIPLYPLELGPANSQPMTYLGTASRFVSYALVYPQHAVNHVGDLLAVSADFIDSHHLVYEPTNGISVACDSEGTG